MLKALLLFIFSLSALYGINTTLPRAIVVDYQTGKILYQKNMHQRCAVASLQKMLTALCVYEHLPLHKKVRIVQQDTQIEPTVIGVKAGEKYRVDTLLKLLLVRSGNDIALTLARITAGSSKRFAKLMTNKARKLQMYNSCFKNPHGLTEQGQYSTAFDMAILARQIFYYPIFRKWVNTKHTSIYLAKSKRTYQIKNTNKVLFSSPYCQGLKTGTTKAAGRCLALAGTKHNKSIIVVALGGTKHNIWQESQKLLHWGLEQ